jgi:hypothetical protein
VGGYTLAAHGAVIDNGDGTFTYSPDANFNGADSFTYTVINSVGLSATATVTVMVTVVNEAPIAEDLQVTTASNTPVTILLGEHDVDGDPVVFALIQGPEWGSLSGTLPLLTYTPQANFVGHDHFTYTVTDPEGLSATATVTITVTGTVTGPVAAYSFDEGHGPTVADASGQANDGTIFGATWSPASRFGSALAFNGVDNWVTVAAAPSLDLTTGLTLEAWVYPIGTRRGWYTILMKEQLDHYVYCLLTHDETDRPFAGVFIKWGEVLSSDVGLPVDTWTHLATTYDGIMQRLYLNGVEVARRLQTGSIQSSSMPLRIGGNSVWGEYFQGRIDEVRIYNKALTVSEIRADMHLPVVPPSVTTAVDGPIDIVVLPNGASGAANGLTVVSVTPGANGTVAINADGTVRYTPTPGFLGPDQFTSTVRDGNGGTATGSVTVTVVYAPVAGHDTVQTVEDTGVTTGNVLANDTDANGASMQLSGFTQAAHGTVVSHGNGTSTYTPVANFNGPDSFTLRVSDDPVVSAPATVEITVAPVNNAPVVIGQSVTTTEDTVVFMTLSGSDLEGDSLTFAIVTGPTQGSLSGVPPQLTYMPNPHSHGTDSFIYTVTDGSGLSATATVTVAVTPVHDAPVALWQSVTTAEDTPMAITLTGSDADGDVLTFSIVTPPTNGTLSGTPPRVTYTPNTNFNGNDSFTFHVSDGTETSLPATVAITVMTTRFVNGGFESGDFTGWSTIGETRIETAAFGSGPT